MFIFTFRLSIIWTEATFELKVFIYQYTDYMFHVNRMYLKFALKIDNRTKMYSELSNMSCSKLQKSGTLTWL